MRFFLILTSACLLFIQRVNAQDKYIGTEYYFRVNVFEIDSSVNFFSSDSAKHNQWFLLNPQFKKVSHFSIVGLDKKKDSLRTSNISTNIFRLYNYNDNFHNFKIDININHQVIWLPLYLIERISHLTSVNVYISTNKNDKGSCSLISLLRTSHTIQGRRNYLLNKGKVKRNNSFRDLSKIKYIFELENYFWDIIEKDGKQKLICNDNEFEKIINQ